MMLINTETCDTVKKMTKKYINISIKKSKDDEVKMLLQMTRS